MVRSWCQLLKLGRQSFWISSRCGSCQWFEGTTTITSWFVYVNHMKNFIFLMYRLSMMGKWNKLKFLRGGLDQHIYSDQQHVWQQPGTVGYVASWWVNHENYQQLCTPKTGKISCLQHHYSSVVKDWDLLCLSY